MTDLSKLKKAELLKLVEEAGLEADADATKAQLVALLEAVPEPAEEVVEETVEEVVEEVVEETPLDSGSEDAEDDEKFAGLDYDLEGKEFVLAAYMAVLKREADAGGLAHYTQAINAGHIDKQYLVDDLLKSAEYKAL